MIAAINKGQATRIDAEVQDALFLKRNPGWKPQDLGYPPADYVLLDLMRMID